MWPIVALATLFKVLMNTCVVGFAVAVVATQNHFVGAAMAEYTLNFGMFGGVFRKLFELATVAAAAQVRSDSRFGKLQCRGTVRLMAAETIFICHSVAMAFMAFEAGHGIAMLLMALVTVHFTMGAGPFNHFGLWRRVARNTHGFDWRHCRQVNFQRCMGLMAGGTVIEFIMAMVTRRMAAGAFGDDTGFAGRMLLMTVAATDFTGMSFTGTIQLADLIVVACCTQLRRCIVLPLVRRRRVGLMAAETILIGHLGGVFVVAVDTGGKLSGGCAVLAVAIVALLLGVQAWLGIHGCSDLVMAGQARQFWGVQSAEVGDDRRMRIVALAAAVKAEVALIVAAVAVAAFRDDGIT